MPSSPFFKTYEPFIWVPLVWNPWFLDAIRFHMQFILYLVKHRKMNTDPSEVYFFNLCY